MLKTAYEPLEWIPCTRWAIVKDFIPEPPFPANVPTMHNNLKIAKHALLLPLDAHARNYKATFSPLVPDPFNIAAHNIWSLVIPLSDEVVFLTLAVEPSSSRTIARSALLSYCEYSICSRQKRSMRLSSKAVVSPVPVPCVGPAPCEGYEPCGGYPAPK